MSLRQKITQIMPEIHLIQRTDFPPKPGECPALHYIANPKLYAWNSSRMIKIKNLPTTYLPNSTAS